jgi:hypothetical protein
VPQDDDLPPVAGARLDLLRGLGFGELTHDSHVPFLSHLVGTRRLLAGWGSSPDLCDAGLFHSVYGTEFFPTAAPVSRSEVRLVIGARAERLAWLWCTIRRDTIDAAAGTALDRHTGDVIVLAPGELSDIATLWAADTVEQLGRMAPHERGFAQGLPAVLHLASAPARRRPVRIAQTVRTTFPRTRPSSSCRMASGASRSG